jgi:hypothetical protein
MDSGTFLWILREKTSLTREREKEREGERERDRKLV